MLVEVFHEVQKSLRLKGVPQYFGQLPELSLAAAPRIDWAPSKDRYIDPRMAMKPGVLGGVAVKVTSHLLRVAGCQVRLYVPAAEDQSDYAAMEDMLNRFLNALRDTCTSFGNYEVGEGFWRDREALSENTLCYVQPIGVYVPIYEAYPTAPITTEQLNPSGAPPR